METGQGEARRARGRPPAGKRKPDSRISIACNWEYVKALGELAEASGLSMADFVALAVANEARRRKLTMPPPRIST